MRVDRYGAFPLQSNARTFAGWKESFLPWVVCDLVEARVLSSHSSKLAAEEQANTLNSQPEPA